LLDLNGGGAAVAVPHQEQSRPLLTTALRTDRQPHSLSYWDTVPSLYI